MSSRPQSAWKFPNLLKGISCILTFLIGDIKHIYQSFQHYIHITLDNRTSICQQLIYPMCALWLRCLHWHHYRYTGAALHTCLRRQSPPTGTAAGGPVMWPLESCTTATPPPAPAPGRWSRPLQEIQSRAATEHWTVPWTLDITASWQLWCPGQLQLSSVQGCHADWSQPCHVSWSHHCQCHVSRTGLRCHITVFNLKNDHQSVWHALSRNQSPKTATNPKHPRNTFIEHCMVLLGFYLYYAGWPVAEWHKEVLCLRSIFLPKEVYF